VEQFFSDQTDDKIRRQLIRDYEIRFVFYGPAENSLGGFDPSEADYLEKVYSSPTVEIFQVR
jgi:uncharacterized membrane protein